MNDKCFLPKNGMVPFNNLNLGGYTSFEVIRDLGITSRHCANFSNFVHRLTAKIKGLNYIQELVTEPHNRERRIFGYFTGAN